jgi:DNA repair protein RadC
MSPLKSLNGERATPDALSDADLLAMLLAAARIKQPRATANALLQEYGSFAEALGGATTGMHEDAATYLATVRAAALRMLHGKIKERPVLSSWPAVLDYLRAVIAFEPREQFRVMFLDKRNQLIADEVHQHGTIDHTPVYPREVVKRAIELGASAILIAHNHPSGDPTPSHADVEMTKAIIAACQVLGIAVHDHVVIGKNGHASFKALRLI